MNSLRRATPDSEAVASSEDERPWPTAKSFGSLPRKENNVPGLGGIWSTQKRDSFKMEKAAQRNAAREAWLAAPHGTRGGLRSETSPSPAASDGSGAIPFSIPMQPLPKAGRSMSYSQGQREGPAAANDHTVLPLGLLAEEVDTDSESELGPPLTHTVSHPPIGTLQRTATLPTTYESYYGNGNGKEHHQGGGQAGSRGDRRFEAALANLSLADTHPRKSQWQTRLGWDDVPNVNESRRHSLADIPTRRGSLVGSAERPHNLSSGAFWADGNMYEWDGGPRAEEAQQQMREEPQQLLQFGQIDFGPNSNIDQVARAAKQRENLTNSNMKYNDLDKEGRSLEVPSSYKVAYVKINDDERLEQHRRAAEARFNQNYFSGRPNRQLYIVSFKCSRVDCFFLLDNTGLTIKAGDIVIVEADRGQDLGTVQHANVTEEEAKIYKKRYGEEQYKWLMMFSKNNQQGSINPNAQVYGENRGGGNLLANAPPTMQGTPRDYNALKPKAIKRLANAHEIHMLSEKEGNEAKAKRACQQKVAHLHLDMEILDAEWQWDFQKLIFYYYADHYINFKDLITELYRIYKTRIWLSAINPASFSQHAHGQPPSGMGPGAIEESSSANTNNNYSMLYGADPDPYGAVPPYRIGFDTYTPNFPSIPGVSNSFPLMWGAPGFRGHGGQQDVAIRGQGFGRAEEGLPSVAPGVVPTGSVEDYNYYYELDANGMRAPMNPGFSPNTFYTTHDPIHNQRELGKGKPMSAWPGPPATTDNDITGRLKQSMQAMSLGDKYDGQQRTMGGGKEMLVPYGNPANMPLFPNNKFVSSPAPAWPPQRYAPAAQAPIGTRPGSSGNVAGTSNVSVEGSGSSGLDGGVPVFDPGRRLE